MRVTSALEGDLRRFMGDAAVFVDAAEDELLILEEDLQAEYSNSGGPAENDLRLENVVNSLEKIRVGADEHELTGMTETVDLAVELTQRVMRQGDLDFTLGRLSSLLLGIDRLRDSLDGLENSGSEGELTDMALESMREAMV